MPGTDTGTGRVAQRESTPFTRVGSQVQSLSRPPSKPEHSRGFRGSADRAPPGMPISLLRESGGQTADARSIKSQSYPGYLRADVQARASAVPARPDHGSPQGTDRALPRPSYPIQAIGRSAAAVVGI